MMIRAAKKHRYRRRAWTEREIEVVRAEWGRFTAAEIGAPLERSASQVYLLVRRLGLAKRVRTSEERAELAQLIRRRHAEGWSDSEIAREAGCSREWAGEVRLGLGLPSNKDNERHRRRVAQKTREQLATAGLSSLAELRLERWRAYARESGWPDDLGPRYVQILNLLHQHGPQTKRQLSDRMGLVWKGCRSSLTSNDPSGSYLGYLTKRGLVVNLGRCVYNGRQGANTALYSLPLHVMPQQPQGEAG